MQIIINRNDIDGIRYLSSYRPQQLKNSSAQIYVNYAFPAPYEPNSQYSSILASKFKVTDPICVHDYNQLSPSNRDVAIRSGTEERNRYVIRNLCRKSNISLDGVIEVSMGRICQYTGTAYSKVEDFLCKFQVKPIEI